jgi:hypothetical protein
VDRVGEVSDRERLIEALRHIQRFMAVYDRFGSRPGLDPHELYGIDGGDNVAGGASIRQDMLRQAVDAGKKLGFIDG